MPTEPTIDVPPIAGGPGVHAPPAERTRFPNDDHDDHELPQLPHQVYQPESLSNRQTSQQQQERHATVDFHAPLPLTPPEIARAQHREREHQPSQITVVHVWQQPTVSELQQQSGYSMTASPEVQTQTAQPRPTPPMQSNSRPPRRRRKLKLRKPKKLVQTQAQTARPRPKLKLRKANRLSARSNGSTAPDSQWIRRLWECATPCWGVGRSRAQPYSTDFRACSAAPSLERNGETAVDRIAGFAQSAVGLNGI
ncbi:hypothetical protein SCHPADRAFT_937185 [Schizopora paradoxa]|uniref:Uncharacterized protein n=1 Tax=Schizopora paradoxa TaxID=27342 RepID=A0A0H2SJL8_9AGAM|nr:hypothetical protein SCHPADRAFT_937185 [Schizopora paradoxa]